MKVAGRAGLKLRPSEKTVLETSTHSPEETMALGRGLASELKAPCLVLLEGELGSGKTTLVKGIVEGLGAATQDQVTSPTFTLVHEYGRESKVYHVDLYRVECSRELSTLGLEDILDSQAVVIVEWGERLRDNAPASGMRVRLEHVSGDERRIVIERREV